MGFARKVWHLLVAVKDGLVLTLLLVFFGALFAALTAQSGPGRVRDGALLLKLNGAVVEEPVEANPLADAFSGSDTPGQTRERDVVRALHVAAKDDQIKAVAIDLTGFGGAGLVHLQEIGAAMDGVRAAKKPVLLFGFALEDAGTLLAAHASEAWIDPLGGAFLPGPGGYRLYYGKLLERLKITAHIFRVGTYKDYVEPYFRNDQSPASRQAEQALYTTIWDAVKADIAHARPKANIAAVTSDPVGWLHASGGDGAKAALAAGLVDHIGSRAEFGDRVAALAGKDDSSDRPGAFAHTGMKALLAAHPESTDGKAIDVVTIAGEIVDGKAGPGTAGGTRIARLIDKAVAGGDLSALVVRVDSPGGSVTASEEIRTAIMRARAKGLPVAVSMANLAASGGYWVSTPGERVFAEPGTITGSIGIFAVIPSFEKLLGEYGVNGDGIRTTPLSGQPDVLSGFTPEVEAMLQADIEAGYRRFIGLVATSRHSTPEKIDTIAQGRAWDGGTARQLGLIDQFGGLDDAVAWAAGKAGLKAGDWHAEYLASEPRPFGAKLLAGLHNSDDGDDNSEATAPRDWIGLIAARQHAALGGALANAARLAGVSGAQAYCLECAGLGAPAVPDAKLIAALGMLSRIEMMLGVL